MLAKRERGTLSGQELVEWAVRLLETGCETPAVVRLAGLDLDSPPLLADALPLFLTSLEQLASDVPSGREGILRAHFKGLVRQLARGQVEVGEALWRIEEEVVVPLGHPADLVAWCYLGSELHPETFAELRGASLEEYVKRIAAEVAADEEPA